MATTIKLSNRPTCQLTHTTHNHNIQHRHRHSLTPQLMSNSTPPGDTTASGSCMSTAVTFPIANPYPLCRSGMPIEAPAQNTQQCSRWWVEAASSRVITFSNAHGLAVRHQCACVHSWHQPSTTSKPAKPTPPPQHHSLTHNAWQCCHVAELLQRGHKAA